MRLDQNVCLDHLWVRFSKCYDTQVSVTGPSWPSVSSPEPKAVVCLSVCSHFETSSLEPLGRLKSNCMWSLHGVGERKFAYQVQVT